MIVRKATAADLQAVSNIYDEIHTVEESGNSSVGWIRNIYPTSDTARNALQREDLFVAEEEGKIVGAAIINQQQMDSYEHAHWNYIAPAQEVMVLHTLVIDPKITGKGYGKEFVRFYERYAVSQGCRYLRIDTQAKNTRARAMYRKLGYREADIVPCEFNGIEGVQLVLLEKKCD